MSRAEENCPVLSCPVLSFAQDDIAAYHDQITMSLVKDILSNHLNNNATANISATAAASALPSAAGSAGSAAGGLAREVQQLMLDNDSWSKEAALSVIPPLAASKNHRNFLALKHKKAVHWELEAIANSARCYSTGYPTEDVKLYHWARIPVPDYRFARLNKSIKLLEYTPSEYSQYLASNEWTNSESDILMQLCKQFDCRFIVIQDRYNTIMEELRNKTRQNSNSQSAAMKQEQNSMDIGEKPNSSTEKKSQVKAEPATKSEPDSKDSSTNPLSVDPLTLLPNPDPSLHSASATSLLYVRYCDRSVEQLKGRYYSIQSKLFQLRNSSDPDYKKHPIYSVQYDQQYEQERKIELNKLYQRTQEQVDEMADIVLQHKNLTQQIKKIKQHTKQSKEANRGSGKAAGLKSKSKSKLKGLQRSSTGVLPSNSGAGAIPPLEKALPSEMAPIPSNCLPAALSAPTALVYRRSLEFEMPANLNKKQQETLTSELTTLLGKDLPLKKLVPTGPVADLLTGLRKNILTLYNLEKYVAERAALRDQLKKSLGIAPLANTNTSLLSSSTGGNFQLYDPSKPRRQESNQSIVESSGKKKASEKRRADSEMSTLPRQANNNNNSFEFSSNNPSAGKRMKK
jgi:hypothetical protein